MDAKLVVFLVYLAFAVLYIIRMVRIMDLDGEAMRKTARASQRLLNEGRTDRLDLVWEWYDNQTRYGRMIVNLHKWNYGDFYKGEPYTYAVCNRRLDWPSRGQITSEK